MNKRIKNTQAGFFLIELLVALVLFGIVMVVSTSSLLALLDANYKARALKSVTDNLNFAMENLSRNIRVGNTYRCGAQVNDYEDLEPRDCANSADYLAFNDGESDGIIEYQYNDTTRTLQRRYTPRVETRGEFVDVTGVEVRITDFDFIVTGTRPLTGVTGANDDTQPFVRMVMRGTINIQGISTDFDLQTAVTQRLIDV